MFPMLINTAHTLRAQHPCTGWRRVASCWRFDPLQLLHNSLMAMTDKHGGHIKSLVLFTDADTLFAESNGG